MATTTENLGGPILVDGVPLKQRLARAERRKRIIAVAMVMPLLLFIMISFVIPIADIAPFPSKTLHRSHTRR